jgi:hypothetical protein
MPKRRPPLQRGEIMGERVGGEPEGQAQHHIKCPACCAWVRDPAQVLVHEGYSRIRSRTRRPKSFT